MAPLPAALTSRGSTAVCAAAHRPATLHSRTNVLRIRRFHHSRLASGFLPRQQGFCSSLVATQFPGTAGGLFSRSGHVGGLFSRSGHVAGQRGALVVVANGKNSMGNTFGGSNRKKRNVSGFKARMATPGGRRVLKRRRNKGRKFLCAASMRKGKYVRKSRF